MQIEWQAPQRPVDYAETTLVAAVLDGRFPPGSALPAERELAAMLGITRPTLREALRRLERDGWLTVQQGKTTLVNDFWRDGGLNILSAIVRHGRLVSPEFVTALLEVRLHLAPAYTAAAVEREAGRVAALLAGAGELADAAPVYAAYDWRVQRELTILSGNPVYTLILNAFTGFYEEMAALYFAQEAARQASQAYYLELLAAARDADGPRAGKITREIMERSIRFWKSASGAGEGG